MAAGDPSGLVKDDTTTGVVNTDFNTTITRLGTALDTVSDGRVALAAAWSDSFGPSTVFQQEMGKWLDRYELIQNEARTILASFGEADVLSNNVQQTATGEAGGWAGV